MAITPISSVTPSLFARLSECPHREGLRRLNRQVAPDARYNPTTSTSVTLGNTAHAVIASALGLHGTDIEMDEWFPIAWDAAIEIERSHCPDKNPPESWWRYSIVRRGTRRLIHRLTLEIAQSGATVRLETELKAKTAPVWGRPDLLMIHNNGACEVIDIKTGVHKGEPASAQEIDQLQMYAFIVAESLDIPVTRLRVERVDGAAWEEASNDAASAETVSAALQAMNEFNRHREDTSPLARPGTACANCSELLACEPAWSAATKGFVGVEGIVTSAYREIDSQVLRIETESGPADVVGIPATDVTTGDIVRVGHLRMHTVGQYRWQPDRSVITRQSQSADSRPVRE